MTLPPSRLEIGGLPWRPLLGWLLIGLALRLVFLPLTIHPDTVAVFYRMGEWRSGHFDAYSFGLQGLPLWLHGLWAEVTRIALPESAWINWETASIPDVREAMVAELGRSGTAWHVALWKLPYALVDLACAGVAASLIARGAGVARGLRVLRLWLLLPVFLYMSSLFGKYESFMLLPLLLGFGNWQRGREERAFVWFGVAIAMRLYPVVLLVPLVLAASASWRRRCEFTVMALLPLLLVLATAALHSAMMVAGLILALTLAWKLYERLRRSRVELVFGISLAVVIVVGLVVLVPKVLAHLASGSGDAGPVLAHAQALARAVIELDEGDAFLLTYVAYGLACLFAHRIAVMRRDGQRAGFDDLVDAGLLASLALFAFSNLNPQYFTLYFALALLRLGRSREASAALAVQLLGFFLLISFAAQGSISVGLFAPVSPRLFSLIPDLLTALPASLEEPGPISIGRTIFLFGSLWMAFEVLRTRGKNESAAGLSLSLGLASLAWPLGLALLIWMPFRSVFERPGPWRVTDVELDGPTPLDGAQLSTWGGIPVAIELKRDLSKLEPGASPGNTYMVINDELKKDKPFPLVISNGDLTADDEGVTRVPLNSDGFRPERTYRLAWTGLNRASTVPLIGRPIFEISGPAALAKAGEDFGVKYFEESRAGTVFFGLAGFALLAGCVLLLGGSLRLPRRFSRS